MVSGRYPPPSLAQGCLGYPEFFPTTALASPPEYCHLFLSEGGTNINDEMRVTKFTNSKLLQ